jgi:ParB-like chromosome segregation protein Spo0J
VNAPSPATHHVKLKSVSVDLSKVYDPTHACNAERLKLRTQSMAQTGARIPPVVRESDRSGYEVLTDQYDIAALKALGTKTVDCVLVDTDDDGAALWATAALFNQREETVLRRADLVAKSCEAVRNKGGQNAQGGNQPHDQGLSATARILGLSRRDVSRFVRIAALSDTVKEEVESAGLDDHQDALLAITKVAEDKQLDKVQELARQHADTKKNNSSSVGSGRSVASHNAKAMQKSSKAEGDSGESEEEAASNSSSAVSGKSVPSRNAGTQRKTSNVAGDSDEPEDESDSPSNAADDEEHQLSPVQIRKRDETKLARLKVIYEESVAAERRAQHHVHLR